MKGIFSRKGITSLGVMIAIFALIVISISYVQVGYAATATPVNLRTAGDFAILSKAAITNVPTSVITGNIGASPITGAAIHVTCAEMLTRKIYEVDAAYVGADMTCV